MCRGKEGDDEGVRSGMRRWVMREWRGDEERDKEGVRRCIRRVRRRMNGAKKKKVVRFKNCFFSDGGWEEAFTKTEQTHFMHVESIQTTISKCRSCFCAAWTLMMSQAPPGCSGSVNSLLKVSAVSFNLWLYSWLMDINIYVYMQPVFVYVTITWWPDHHCTVRQPILNCIWNSDEQILSSFTLETILNLCSSGLM